MLAAWPKLTSLNWIAIWIDLGRLAHEPVPHFNPTEWTLPTRLRALDLHVYDNQTRDLFAALVKASASTLRHLGLSFSWSSRSHDVEDSLPDAVAPVATNLTSFRRVIPGEAYGPCSLYATIIATFPNLTQLPLPLGRIRLPQLTPALSGRAPLVQLVLYDDDGGCEDDWDDLIAFLGAVRVERLKVGASFYFMVDDESYGEGTEGEQTREEAVDDAREEAGGLVGELGWLDWGEWR